MLYIRQCTVNYYNVYDCISPRPLPHKNQFHPLGGDIAPAVNSWPMLILISRQGRDMISGMIASLFPLINTSLLSDKQGNFSKCL